MTRIIITIYYNDARQMLTRTSERIQLSFPNLTTEKRTCQTPTKRERDAATYNFKLKQQINNNFKTKHT
jgi:hypothetical protein